jgi:uncharacterized protein involved in exopolysaccharide biosynthesis
MEGPSLPADQETVSVPPQDALALSFARLVALVFARRRLVLTAAVACGLLAGVFSLLSTRQYQSVALFIPEEGQTGAMDIAAAARQLGIGGLQPGRSSWSAGTYAEVLRSPAIVQSIALDTFTVLEEDDRRATLIDLLEVSGSDSGTRVDRATKQLTREVIGVAESRLLGTVRVTAATPWPSVSQQIVEGLLERVHQFNLEVRQRRAGAEARFAEQRAAQAEAELLAAEDKLRRFLERNRVIEEGTMLAFERARAQREVTLQQQVYTQLVVAREDARLREVRDTPLLTVLQEPMRPTLGVPRGTVFRGILGALAGVAIGIGLLVLGELRRDAAQWPETERAAAWRAFESLLPRWARRWLP